MGCARSEETCFLLGLLMSFTRVKCSIKYRVSLGIRRHDVSQRPEKPIVTAFFRAYLTQGYHYFLHEMQCAHFSMKSDHHRWCLPLTQ